MPDSTWQRDVFIIAEAGVNHNGSLERAREMVRVAKNIGADAVKFQTFSADALVARGAPKADYQKQATGVSESQLDMLRRLELDEAETRELLELCDENGIQFISSPFDLASVDLLARLNVRILKIPSGELINVPYLRRVGAVDCRIILSTGMSELDEIERSLEVLQDAGSSTERITLLHCTTEYPAPYGEVNLRAMRSMGERFGVEVGYSDHTLGIEIPVAAVALGARVIEKHFTLDRSLPGPDHQASLEPDAFAAMVDAIRNVEAGLGDGHKRRTPSEERNRLVARKSVVAARDIRCGEVFTEHNLTAKRPGTGISPLLWDDVVGQRAKRNFEPDEMIEL